MQWEKEKVLRIMAEVDAELARLRTENKELRSRLEQSGNIVEPAESLKERVTAELTSFVRRFLEARQAEIEYLAATEEKADEKAKKEKIRANIRLSKTYVEITNKFKESVENV